MHRLCAGIENEVTCGCTKHVGDTVLHGTQDNQDTQSYLSMDMFHVPSMHLTLNKEDAHWHALLLLLVGETMCLPSVCSDLYQQLKVGNNGNKRVLSDRAQTRKVLQQLCSSV